MATALTDGVSYQEPLLYFRIHHWFQVARRLDFSPTAAQLAEGEEAARRKQALFLSLQLQSPRVEAEEAWLLSLLRRLRSPTVFCHNDLQEGNLILEAKAHRHADRPKEEAEGGWRQAERSGSQRGAAA